MKMVYESDTFKVLIYEDQKILHHTVKKFMFGESFKENMMKAADSFEEYKCTK